nr:PQQ-binding-like beta-propeller repeat protein [Actinomycetota bacterium]
GRGFTSTAAVAVDPSAGGPVVYVAAADGYLYALRARDGSTVWRSLVVHPGTTENAGYNWGSPTVVDGRVYMGISSQCDHPLVRGGVREYDQAAGALLRTYWSLPKGSTGGSVWTSTASDGTSVWATVGNADPTGTQPGDSFSIVRLDGSTLQRLDRWRAPVALDSDLDWGSSPTLFNANVAGVAADLVGACNKNGTFYALERGALAKGPVWHRKIGEPEGSGGICLAAAIWDSMDKRLVVASNRTIIGGQTYPGGVRALNPATGHPIWERGLSGGPVLGSPSMDGSGVIAAATFSGAKNALYLINGSTGEVLNTISLDSGAFAQPIFAGPYVFVAPKLGGLFAYQPSS